MNAAVVHSFSAHPRYESFADPVAAEGEAIVTVTAAGLHRVVKSIADGSHYTASASFPFIPGIDGVGLLDDGSRVYFFMARSPYGTFAERSVTMRATCYPLPDHLDGAEIAGSINPAMSSWAALKLRAEFAAGESVLILGASGVSGRLAIQIARRLGAKRVVGAARNPGAIEGADAAIALDAASLRAELAANKIDVVLDYLWGPPAEAFFEAVSAKGLKNAGSRMRYIQIGSSAAANANLQAASLRGTDILVLGSGFGSASMPKLLKAMGEFIAEAAREPFKFKIKGVPLREIETHWHADEQGARIVILPK
jgi:NADPH:quinone reductase-like Zn-dependent oxidoreductase